MGGRISLSIRRMGCEGMIRGRCTIGVGDRLGLGWMGTGVGCFLLAQFYRAIHGPGTNWDVDKFVASLSA